MKKKIILLVTDIVIAALILLGVWIINYKIRRMRLIKQILFHTAVICGLVCLTAKILDWYNPFMDFSGHVSFIPVSGCVSVLVLGILNIVGIYRRNLEVQRNRRGSFRIAAHR